MQVIVIIINFLNLTIIKEVIIIMVLIINYFKIKNLAINYFDHY